MTKYLENISKEIEFSSDINSTKIHKLIDSLETALTAIIPITTYSLRTLGYWEMDPNDFNNIRPDLWEHSLLGYGVGKIIRKSHSHFTDNPNSNSYVASTIGTSGLILLKECYDSLTKNGVLDMYDAVFSYIGLFSEFIKSEIFEK